MSTACPIRLLVVSTTLTTGGAEWMLWKLLRRLPPDRFRSTVLSLGASGRPAAALQADGIDVVTLGLPQMRRLLASPLTAWQLLRRVRPHLIQGWMYHGNLAASVLCGLSGFGARLTWSVRQSLDFIGREKPMTRAVIRASALVSSGPAKIIYVTRGSREQHEAVGFAHAHGCVIPNGFDLDEIYRRPERRDSLRRQWGVSSDEFVVGHLARFHPAKDHLRLIQAAREVVRKRPNVRFVMAGTGVSSANSTLARAISDCELGSRVLLADETQDPVGFLSACDLFCLPSLAEGFSNALGEALACELPAVVTRAGASPELVGECGMVVDPGDSDALAAALLAMVDLEPNARQELGAKARARIEERYSLTSIVRQYASLYETLVCRP